MNIQIYNPQGKDIWRQFMDLASILGLEYSAPDMPQLRFPGDTTEQCLTMSTDGTTYINSGVTLVNSYDNRATNWIWYYVKNDNGSWALGHSINGLPRLFVYGGTCTDLATGQKTKGMFGRAADSRMSLDYRRYILFTAKGKQQLRAETTLFKMTNGPIFNLCPIVHQGLGVLYDDFYYGVMSPDEVTSTREIIINNEIFVIGTQTEEAQIPIMIKM